MLRARSLMVTTLLMGCGGAGAPPAAEPPPAARPAPPRATPEPAPTAVAPTEAASGGCGEGMVLVEGGKFWMGSAKGQGHADEEPTFQVDVPTYCLDAAEVTVDQYQGCVKNAVCPKLTGEVEPPGAPATAPGARSPVPVKDQEARSLLCTTRREGGGALPVTCVDHDDATKFCEWRGRRLPTEAELEYAATSGADKLAFPWGAAPPDEKRLCWQRKDGPCQSGSFPAGSYGLYDLAGNVAEWTSTPFGAYPGPAPGGTRYAVRGSSWLTTAPDDVRPRRRFSHELGHRDIDLGFRCAKTR